jgi:prepilin-type N-terminal cleavage/methylation domain-containing protein
MPRRTRASQQPLRSIWLPNDLHCCTEEIIMPRHAYRGFTLIELLVVIAIIGILAAMLFPVFAQAREKARSITCISNIKQLGYAIFMYQQDYDGVFPAQDHLYIDSNCPFWMDVAYGVPDWLHSPYVNWAQGIYSYTSRSKEIYQCKSNRGYTAGSDQTLPGLSYIYNGFAAEAHEAGVAEPAHMILLWDYRYLTSYAVVNPAPPTVNGCPPPGCYCYYQGWSPHQDQFNLLYFDYHAKNKHESQFYSDIWGLRPGNPFSF